MRREQDTHLERTTLAWRRTALSLAIAAAVGARMLFAVLDVLGVIAAVVGIGVAIGFWAVSVQRYRQAHRCLVSELPRPLPGAAPLAGAAALATALGVLAMAFLVTGFRWR